MSSSDQSKALLMQYFLKDLTIMLSGMAFHAADTHRVTSEGAARKGRLKERCGLEPRNNFFFFRLRNRQNLVRIRFENIWYYPPNYANALQVSFCLIFPDSNVLRTSDLPYACFMSRSHHFPLLHHPNYTSCTI